MTLLLGYCEYCGDPLEQPLRGRNRRFCNEQCRKDHRDEIEEGRRDDRV